MATTGSVPSGTTVLDATLSAPAEGHAPAPPKPTGTLTALDEPRALLEFVPDKPGAHGKPTLYSYIRGSVHQIDVKAKTLKDTHIVSKVTKAWNIAKDFIIKNHCEHASNIEVTANPNPDAPERDIVSISYTDAAGIVRHIGESGVPNDLVLRMHKLRTLIRPNRDFTAAAPLKISMPGFLSESCKHFLETEFEEFEQSLPAGPAKDNALRTVLTAEAMTQGFSMHLGGLIEKKEEELKKLEKDTPLPYIPIKKAKEELEKLKKLHKELENIDRRAVFRAIGTWGNLNTGHPIDDKTRKLIRQAADTATLGSKKNFEAKEKARHDKHWVQNKLASWMPWSYKPLDAKEAHSASLDLGNLLLADRWESQERKVDNDQDDATSCVEQLIVEMMMNLENTAVSLRPNHPMIERLDETTKGELIGGVIEAAIPADGKGWPAKNYARAVYEQLGKMPSLVPTTPLETRLQALRHNRDLRFRFDKLLGAE
jgi:hypothetical protein